MGGPGGLTAVACEQSPHAGVPLLMRILHVIRRLDPYEGGPPAVVSRLAAAQASMRAAGAGNAPGGHDVSVLHHPAGSRGPAFDAIPGFGLVKRHEIPEPKLAAWLDANLKSFDVLHLHGVWDSILVTAASKARASGVPYAVVPHGMLDPWSLNQQGLLKSIKKKVSLALTHRSFLNGAAFLHVLNADEGRLLAPLKLKPEPIVIPNGIFLEEVTPLPPAGTFRAKHPELGSDPYILFLSRLHHKKGLDVLADAFALVVKDMPNARLVVAGPDGGAEAPFRSQIQRLGLANRVHLTGPLFGTDKLAVFRDASVFCLASRQEGFSMAVTEALGCRCPVVISDQCHFPDVDEVKAGFVVPLSAPATAAALLKILRMPAHEGQAMGARGHDLVAARYTWPAIAAQSISVYERLLRK
jgi:glycosyltransferase involved in cell wall biosynthesis